MKRALLFLACLLVFVPQVEAGSKGRRGEHRGYSGYDPVAESQLDTLGIVYGQYGMYRGSGPFSYGYYRDWRYSYDPCYSRSRSVLGRVIERGACREIDSRAHRRDRQTDFDFDRRAERAADESYREGRQAGYERERRDERQRSETARMQEQIAQLEKQVAQRSVPEKTPAKVIDWACTSTTEPSLNNDHIKVKNMTSELVSTTEQGHALFARPDGGRDATLDLPNTAVVCLPGPITRYTFQYLLLTQEGRRACPVKYEVNPEGTMYILTYSPQGGGCK